MGKLEAEEPSGRNFDVVEASASGRHLGSVWEASGGSLGALAGLGDPGAPDGSLKQIIAMPLN